MNNLSLLCLVGWLLLGSPGTSRAAGDYKMVSVGTRPQSVIKGFKGDYFVADAMDQKPGRGVIRRLPQNGESTLFVSGLDSPRGLAFTGQSLLVADGKKIWRIDSAGRKTILVEERDFPVPIRQLTDLVLSASGKNVYVSDMGAVDKMMGPEGLWPAEAPQTKALPVVGRIFRVSMAGLVEIEVDTTPLMPTPSGLALLPSGQLLIVDYFTGNLLRSFHGKVKVVRSGFRGGTGLYQDSNGNIFISSNTRSQVWFIDHEAAIVNPAQVVRGLQVPGDFYLDERRNQLLIPDAGLGQVMILNLKTFFSSQFKPQFYFDPQP